MKGPAAASTSNFVFGASSAPSKPSRPRHAANLGGMTCLDRMDPQRDGQCRRPKEVGRLAFISGDAEVLEGARHGGEGREVREDVRVLPASGVIETWAGDGRRS